MKKIIYFSLVLTSLMFVLSSCKKDPVNPPVEPENPNKYVNDWIYENMVTYYLWNDKIPKSPDLTLAPTEFFNSLINKFDAASNPDGDRFSWIQESYVDLLNSLGGVTSDDIGFEYVRVGVSQTSDQLYLLVLYPKIGSDAEAKGVSKGRFITKINGSDITRANASSLTGGTGSKTLTMADWVLNTDKNEYELKLSGNVEIMMHKNFAEIPVYLDSVYTTPNNTKVGYLVYNFFARDKGDNSSDYDKLLMNKLESIKSKGATEFVLDLRYNGGGAVSTATALASALVKNRSTSTLFYTVQYNMLVHNELERQSGSNYNKAFFKEKITDSDGNLVADIPQMGINRVYVLVSSGTASASEMVINGLKPHMDVILIGETTVGKNVGSISLYEEDDPKNKWGMQPIIAKYYNSANKSDFTSGFTPDYEIDEFEGLRLVDFGNTEDKLLNKALTLINGAPLQAAPQRAPRMSSNVNLQPIKESESYLEKPSRNIIIDDEKGDEIRKIMKRIR